MAVKRIVSPGSWANGTVATPTWFSDAQDTINGNLAASVTKRAFRDDFGALLAAAQTSTGILSGFWNVTLATNMSLNYAINPGAIGSGVMTAGVLNISNAANAALSMTMSAFPANITSSQNIYFACRVRIPTRASLDTVANVGWSIGFGSWAFSAGNDNANWQYVDGGGIVHTTSTALTNGQWYTFRYERIGGTSTWYIDDTSVATVSSDTISGTNLSLAMACKSLAVTSTVIANIDYIGVDLPSSSAG